jgi:hypothetical protein
MGQKTMRIAIAGASGLIGSELVTFWGSLGHAVHRLVRDRTSEDTDIPWDPAIGRLIPTQVEGFDAVVCLSGAGIADAKWTPRRKEALRDSRIGPVSLLASTLAGCANKPECLICASAVGYYGADRGAEVLTEDSSPGDDFLARLCVDWERAAQPAHEAGIRVVQLRFGVVLTPKGGALRRMLPPFRLGLGGALGPGRQVMSWITLDDAVTAADFVMHSENLIGPVNATSPNPVPNLEFAKALGAALHRPAFLRVPAFVLRRTLGEMSVLLLGSERAFPRRLESAGFRFRHPEVGPALRDMLK